MKRKLVSALILALIIALTFGGNVLAAENKDAKDPFDALIFVDPDPYYLEMVFKIKPKLDFHKGDLNFYIKGGDAN